MFNWFKKSDYTNVVKFPTPVPYIEPPKVVSEILYSIGVTSDRRIAINVGYSTLTVNRQGVEDLIQQLSVFRDQLIKEEQNENRT